MKQTCQNCNKEFLVDSNDQSFYDKMHVPSPTFCAECRAIRRMAYRNERALYVRKSDLSGKQIFATYPAEVPFPVYSQDEWFSDAWDPMDYGREYDFSRPFFEQFFELSHVVPKPAKSAIMMVNSDYSNNASSLKNCYALFNSAYSEDCAYGNDVGHHSNNCFDNSHVGSFELAYETIFGTRSSRVFFSQNIVDCADVYFSKNLRGCNDCFGCVNLRSKSYHIFNKPYSKEEYRAKLAEFDIGSYAALQRILEKARAFWMTFPNKFCESGARSVDVSGEYLFNSKNVKNSYLVTGGEDLRYCQYTVYPAIKDCYDHLVFGEDTTRTYECAMVGGGINNLRFCLQSYPNLKDMEYCEYCVSSSDLFGCVGLRSKQYCILNKQYDKESFDKLRKEIIDQMNSMPYKDSVGREYRYGEFFPASFSPFGYNETIAQEYFPLTKDEAEAGGYNWRDVESKGHAVTLPHTELPDHIKDVKDDILKETIGCAHEGQCNDGCAGAFKLIPSEVEFYRRFNIPVPRLCITCRHRERLRMRNGMRLYAWKCQCAGEKSESGVYANSASHVHGTDHCPNEFETSYGKDREEIVYCETCYQQEVV